MSTRSKAQQRKRRHYRVRNRLAGTSDRPRMAVYRSNNHMTVQFIDDQASVTIAAVSTQQEAFKGKRTSVETARELGTAAAEAAKGKGIASVVFDRGGFKYTGRVAALADAAREAGLEF